MTLGDSFMEIAKSVPALLKVDSFSPSWKEWKSKSTWSLIFDQWTKITLGRSLLSLAVLVPIKNRFTPLVP